MATNTSKVKKISPTYLRNVALWYLERFGGTRHRVRQVLHRRAEEAAQVHGEDPHTGQWIEDVLDELENFGHLNDLLFAQSRVQRGLRQGKSRRLIEQELSNAGVSSAIQQEAISALDMSNDDQEIQAARTYVARHRLGYLRDDPESFEQKDLARLARRGFSYQTARRALGGDCGQD